MQWTDEQQNAITARGCNLLVSAAAGSGKTAVLVERIKQMILKDKIDIDRLLIVTFTNAAAGEMRERIGIALLEELEKRKENEENIRRQLNLLNQATISTLHSFCMEIVRRHFHIINIDPNFRIGDTTEIGILKMESLEDLLEEEYKKADERFLGLVERFGGNREDTPLQELILKLYDFIQSKPHPYDWLKEKAEDFGMDLETFKNSLWYQTIIEQIRLELSGAREKFIKAKEFCEKPGGPIKYKEAILDDIQQTDNLIKSLDEYLEDFSHQIRNNTHKTLARVSKKDVNEELQNTVKELRQQGKDILKEIKEKFFAKSLKEYIEDLNNLYPYMKYLNNLVFNFATIYKQRKIERGIVDFNDLEHYALAILENEQIAKEYRDRYEYIFVDEYQDSNIVQETILNFIKRDNNLFMVGDVKQSVYRFRLADPTLFMEKYKTYQNQKGVVHRRIDLGKNFRSRGEIIDGVNFIFKHIMTKELGEMNYDTNAYLYRGIESHDGADSPVEVYFIEKVVENNEIAETNEFEEWEELEDMEAEAKVAAEKIKQLLQTTIYDSRIEKFRNIFPKDIVVLLRTTKNWAQTFLEVFMEEGIPVYADINTGYFDTLEISIFMNLLKIIDNKRQDTPLLSVMRSTIGKFSIEELIEIRTHNKEESFSDAMQEYAQYGEETFLREKCSLFLEKLSKWKEEARYMYLDEFIWKLFMDTGYYDYVGAMPGGVQRKANLRMLLERARQFQDTSIKGLFNFIKFIDKLKQSSADMGTAKILGENDDVVRIMSIHKSKGLEFPVVIVGGLGKQFNLTDTNAPILFHKDLGIGPQYVDPELRCYTDTIAKIAMKSCIRTENLSEEMRILYVAMTRAKEKLIMIGSIKDIEKAARNWAAPLSIYNLSKGKNYLDWIAPVIMRHPDGKLLRKCAKVEWAEEKLFNDNSKWVLYRLNKKDVWKKEYKKTVDKLALQRYLQNFKENFSQDEQEFVNQRLSWQYPYSSALNIPSKLSVTEIRKLSLKGLEPLGWDIPSLIQKPKFVEEEKSFSGAEKGTIIHFVMQHLDLENVESIDKINAQIQRMIDCELLTMEEASVIEDWRILAFFNSHIGKRMLSASNVYREVPFNFIKKACDIAVDWQDCKENLLIQGIIDCYFEEGDGIILLDYKTDYLFFGSRKEMIEQYRIQMELYKEALESITCKKVKETYLYLFSANEEVKL